MGDVVKKTTIILICVIVILTFFSAMYFFNPRVVNVTEEVAKIDTLYFTMKETSPPDTIYQYRTKLVHDTVAILQGTPDDVIIVGNGKPETGDRKIPSPEGLGVGAPYYKSVKNFSTKFLIGRVDAWAKCRVDSFTIETHLDREAFAKFYGNKIEPESNNNWLYYVGGGILAGGLIIELVK
jgi:hypothetical protein